MGFTKDDFGEGFAWGVSTAAYQVEGAHNADGKGPSIWDTFAKRKRKIMGGHHGDTACDFYNRYADDLALIYEMNISNYRFSISWSRILPHGIGAVNKKGIDFYNRVIDFCLELGIEPWITLYHWDLPEALQQKGGWTNREVIHWFSYFVDCCIKNFGDRVKYWMVLNEPMVFTGAGYFLGVHAPGKKGLSSFLAAAHHAALCQAEGGRMIKSLRNHSKVGTTFSYSHIEPFRSTNEKDIAAGIKVDALLNRLFIEPLMGLGYPTKELKILERIERYMHPHDEKKLQFDMDFVGLQNYTREMVAYAPLMPFVKAKIIKASQRNVTRTLMDWEVHPPCIYHALHRYNSYDKIKEIVVTENGAAFHDIQENGMVNDAERLQYLQDHIAQVLLAKREGIKVNGYFVWTLMDNFEWAEGYYPRFGLVHVDFATQKRTVKNSGKWYSEFLKNTTAMINEEGRVFYK
ncbi:MAG: beta-glucosidase [Bacteroidetes bacterium]|nr:beta-glucosidase [Bacteroidota bacterium]